MEFKGYHKFIVFCFVGVTSALIHLIVFNIFFKIFNIYLKFNFLFFGATINYVFSTIMGIVISIIYNFSMNRNITFSAKHETVIKQLPRHFIVYASSISVGFIVGLIALNLLGENTINANIANVLGILASIPISFFGSMLWTFKKNSSK